MTETEAAKLLADLRARYGVEPYDANRDLTIAQIMTLCGLSEAQARKAVAEEVAAGRMTVRKATVNSVRANVYRRK